MKKFKFAPLLKEAEDTVEKIPLTSQQKKEMAAAISQYRTFEANVFTNVNILKIAEDIKEISEMASRLAQESATGDFINKNVVNNEMKTLISHAKSFEKAAKEINESNQELQVAYENIGFILNRYFILK